MSATPPAVLSTTTAGFIVPRLRSRAGKPSSSDSGRRRHQVRADGRRRDGTGWQVTLRGRHVLTAAVYIDHNAGTIVKDAFVVSEPLSEVVEWTMIAILAQMAPACVVGSTPGSVHAASPRSSARDDSTSRTTPTSRSTRASVSSYEDTRRGMLRGTNHSTQEATRDAGRQQKAQLERSKASASTRSTGLRRRERRFESCRGHRTLPAYMAQR
jgi:hypothetical protein